MRRRAEREEGRPFLSSEFPQEKNKGSVFFFRCCRRPSEGAPCPTPTLFPFFFLDDDPPPSMAPTKDEEVVEADQKKTPPKKDALAADAKPFVPSSSPPRPAAAPAPAAKDREDGDEAEKEARSEVDDVGEKAEEASSSAGESFDGDEGEQQPARQKTFPVFTDQQRIRPSMQVRVRGGGEERREPGSAHERAVFGWAFSLCQLAFSFDDLEQARKNIGHGFLPFFSNS